MASQSPFQEETRCQAWTKAKHLRQPGWFLPGWVPRFSVEETLGPAGGSTSWTASRCLLNSHLWCFLKKTRCELAANCFLLRHLTGCMTLGRLVHLSGSHFPICPLEGRCENLPRECAIMGDEEKQRELTSQSRKEGIDAWWLNQDHNQCPRTGFRSYFFVSCGNGTVPDTEQDTTHN